MRKILPLITCLFLAHHAIGQGPRGVKPAQGPLTAREIFAALDKRDFTSLKPVTMEQIWSVVRRGRPTDKLKEGFRTTLRFKDGFGRSTNVLIDVPKNPDGVLFVLHGLGGDRFQLGQGTFDRFAKRNRLILVAPDAQKEPRRARNEDIGKIGGILQHWWSYRPDGFVMQLLWSLKRTYKIDPNRVYLTGHSMGAFATWNIGLRYPDRFAALIPISGGISRREYMMRKPDKYLRNLLYNASNANVLFIHGESDKIVPVLYARRTRDDLRKFGYAFDYVELKGARHMLDFREGEVMMNGIDRWIKSKRRNPHPKSVRHRAIAAYMNYAYWIRIDEGKFPNAQVDARIRPNNRIVIETKRVGKMTVFIDETLLDVKRPITIQVNGRRAFSGLVPLNGATVVESWLAREDRDLVYRGKVEIDVNKLARTPLPKVRRKTPKAAKQSSSK